MAAELAASERLNYLSKKQRAVSSRHARQIISANNGNSFHPGSFSTIPIPGHQAATYLDFQNSYLKFTIENNDPNASVKLASGFDLIQQIELLADGVTLSNIQNYNVLVDQYMSSEVGKEWKDNFGRSTAAVCDDTFDPTFVFTAKTLTANVEVTGKDFSQAVNSANVTAGQPAVIAVGEGQKVRGEIDKDVFKAAVDGATVTGQPSKGPVTIASNGKLTLCLPLVLTPLFSVNKYIPLIGKSTLTLRITWASAARGFNGSASDAEIKYTPVEFIASQVRLSADANQMVMQNTGGVFELVCSDYRAAQGHLDLSKDAAVAYTTGFSFSSFDRLSCSFYPHATLLAADKFSIRNRAKAFISNFALAINGEEFPKKRIDVSSTNISETLSELGLAHRSLADFNHQSSFDPDRFALDQPAATAALSQGQFLAMLDLEAMQPHMGDSLYSGMTTTGSTVQLVAAINKGDTNISQTHHTCFMFANFTSALVLDMNGSQSWSMSL